ncbi:TPA: VOC family protein [Streptococcus suis]
MIKSVEVYLVTNGNGQEAIKFYQDALGASVTQVNLFGDFMPDLPEEMKGLVMNAQLDVNGQRIMLSDNNPEFPYVEGNNITAALIFDNAETAEAVYNKLSVNAKKIEMPLQAVPWSPAYGSLTDQFGINWQINAEVEGYGGEYYGN